MGIGDGDLGRHMRHDVGIVDHSVSLGQAGGNIGGEIFVSDARLSESVELVNVAEEVVDVQGSDGGECGSQTVSSNEYFGAAVKGGQFLDFSSNIALNSCESIVEALVDLAA
jgi:hypothetical protein